VVCDCHKFIFRVDLTLYNAVLIWPHGVHSSSETAFWNRVPVYHTHHPGIFYPCYRGQRNPEWHFQYMSSSMVNLVLSQSHEAPSFLSCSRIMPVLLPPFPGMLKKFPAAWYPFFQSFPPDFAIPLPRLQWKHDRCPYPERIFTCHAGTPDEQILYVLFSNTPCAAPRDIGRGSQSYRVYRHQALDRKNPLLTNIDTIYPLLFRIVFCCNFHGSEFIWAIGRLILAK